MSETSPAQMPTVSQSRLKDTQIAVGSDSDSKTTTDTPFGVIISNDGRLCQRKWWGRRTNFLGSQKKSRTIASTRCKESKSRTIAHTRIRL